MPALLAAFAAGLVFGLGLTISQMINPEKVLGFLDLFGAWDPTLAFVMGGALLVTLPGYRLLRGRTAPLFADRFRMPERSDIDRTLIGGSAVFGLGWGLGGFCPGPALSALSTGRLDALIFVAAMIAGMALHRFARSTAPARITHQDG